MLQLSNFYTKYRRTNIIINIEIPYVFQVQENLIIFSERNAFMHPKLGLLSGYVGSILTKTSAYLLSLVPIVGITSWGEDIEHYDFLS